MKENKLLPTQKIERMCMIRHILRIGLEILFVFLAFLFSTSGDFPKPILLLPMALIISTISKTYMAAIWGSLLGLLMDISSQSVMGLHALLLFPICMVISFLYQKYLRPHFTNFLWISILASFYLTGMEFVLRYALWDVTNAGYLYRHYFFFVWIYTVIGGIMIYPIFRFLYRYLLPEKTHTIEIAVKPIADD